jgi:hypothetical protein
MEEVEDRLAVKVQALSDLELAVLICLLADQHCIIESELSLLNDIEEELTLVRKLLLPLSYVILICTDCERCFRTELCGASLYRRHYA